MTYSFRSLWAPPCRGLCCHYHRPRGFSISSHSPIRVMQVGQRGNADDLVRALHRRDERTKVTRCQSISVTTCGLVKWASSFLKTPAGCLRSIRHASDRTECGSHTAYWLRRYRLHHDELLGPPCMRPMWRCSAQCHEEYRQCRSRQLT